MPKDIVIIPASGQIEFSGSSTHHNVLTVDSSSIRITTDEFRIVGGNIVAEQFVVSSSVTHLTSSAMSGSTIFGNTVDDTHKFTGHITASGNIKAGGDISASGDLYANEIHLAGSKKINFVNSSTFINGTDNALNIDGDNFINLYADDYVKIQSGYLVVGSHITASGNISASGTLDVTGNVNFDGDLDVDGTTNLDVVDIDGTATLASTLRMTANQFHYYDESNSFGWRAFDTPSNGRIFMNKIGGVGGLMSMSGSAFKAYVGINTGTAGGHANIGLTVNGMVSASSQLSTQGHITASGNLRVDGNINNRFQLSYDYNGRTSAAGRFYTKGDRGGFAAYATDLGANPSSSAVSYLAAARYSSYTAPRACKLVRMQHTMLNYTNDDDIYLGVYKGTAVNDSAANITITQIGTDIGSAMNEDETFMFQTDFSSGNTLAAGDFILFCIHTPAYTARAYPRFNITLELQYT